MDPTFHLSRLGLSTATPCVLQRVVGAMDRAFAGETSRLWIVIMTQLACGLMAAFGAIMPEERTLGVASPRQPRPAGRRRPPEQRDHFKGVFLLVAPLTCPGRSPDMPGRSPDISGRSTLA